MKIFVYGIHDCHCGSNGVTQHIRSLIEADNHVYLDQRSADWREADYILVNGEGSIYGDRGENGGKLKICRKAKQAGIPSSLINTVWQNITDPTAIDILKNDIDHVVVREAISYNEIKQHRPDAKISSDLAYDIPYTCSVSPTTKRYGVGGFFNSPGINFKNILPGYKKVNIRQYNDWYDYLDDLQDISYMVTGYHHEVIAACKLRIPFIAYRGTTDKVLGIIKRADVNIDVAETPEQLLSNIKKPINTAEYNKLFDYMESKKSFELSDIGITPERKKKRAALCISGEPRMYKHTYKSLSKYIRQLDSQWEVDIFIHAWNTTSTPRNYQDGRIENARVDDYEQTYNITDLRADLIQKYRPKRILVESKKVLYDLVDYYGVRVPAEQIIGSNFLAMSQHISAERCAYLKSGKDIILPSECIVGKPIDNNYDIVIKTRFDVMWFPERSQLDNIHGKVSGFDDDKYDRTQYGMTFFPSMTVRNGRLACEFGHFWSGNTQFDMIYDSFFRRLHSSTDVDIYESCHHHAFASHCLNCGLSLREWRKITKPSKTIDSEGGRDFIWVMPGSPFGEHPISTYRKHYKEYAKGHGKRMKKVDEDLKEHEDIEKLYQEKLRREQEEYDTNMLDVHNGIKKDIWYNEQTYFIDIDLLVTVEDIDIATLPDGTVVEWCQSGNEWIKSSRYTKV